jgi:trehalose/maltose transport system permease protein
VEATTDSEPMPTGLYLISRVMLLAWLLIAAFPLFWMAVMSVRLPVDAFSSNPLKVILGPQTGAVSGGISALGIAIATACIWATWRALRVTISARNPRQPGRIFQTSLKLVLGVTTLLAVIIFIIPMLAGIIELRLATIPVIRWFTTPLIGLTFEHYRVVWIDDAFYRQFLNSMLVTTGVVTISISLGTLAAYGLARSKSQLAFWLLMAALIFRAMPHSVLVAGYLPVFANSREWLQPLWDAPVLGTVLGFLSAEPPTLYGKPVAVISILVAINQPFTIWMLRSFFMSIPSELDDAARVDGCTQFGAFWRIILPVMWPGVLTTALFSFLLAYNDYLVGALLLDAQSQTMVPTISQYINSENNLTDQLRAIAAAVSVTAPLFLLVMVFQKRIVSGLTLGAVKG